MSYEKGYNYRVERLENLQYVVVELLQQTITKLKNIQFSLQSQRTEGIKILGDMDVETRIFSKKNRFPENVAYISIQEADWPFKFGQLRSSLNYKVPDVAQTNKDLTDKSTNFQSDFTNDDKTGKSGKEKGNDDATICITSMSERIRFEKAQLAFTTGIADLENQIKDSVLTQDWFEMKHSLHWKD
jgi:hypothetical protein